MQYITKPRFFTDFINAQRQGGYSFTYSVAGGGGLDTSSNEFNLVDGNPCNPIHFESLGSSQIILIYWKDKFGDEANTTSNTNSCIESLQILGHNLRSCGAKITLMQGTSSAFSTHTKMTMNNLYGSSTEVESGGVPQKVYTLNENGSHIYNFSVGVDHNIYWGLQIEPTGANFLGDIKIGSMRLGSIITAPHAVNVSEKHESAKNFRKVKSVGGNVYSYRTHKNQTWLDKQPPFQNYSHLMNMNDLPAHSYGMIPTSYSMDFSYVSDADYMNANENILTLQSDKTFNGLYNQTLGGHLPVIMQKDSPATQTTKKSDFSWGYIDTFRRTRIAPNLWNVSMGFSEDL